METCLAVDHAADIKINSSTGELVIDVSKPARVRVLAVDRSGRMNSREYFLKVTERKGLVLV